MCVCVCVVVCVFLLRAKGRDDADAEAEGVRKRLLMQRPGACANVWAAFARQDARTTLLHRGGV